MITVLSVNRSARPKSNISEDVAVPDDTFLTEFRDYCYGSLFVTD